MAATDTRRGNTAQGRDCLGLRRIKRAIIFLGWISVCAGPILAPADVGLPAVAENLIVNGDFEKDSAGWDALWTRDAAAGKVVLDPGERHGGSQALRVEHRGDKDWSLAQTRQLGVVPGQIYELSAWVRLQGEGTATLSVVTRTASGEVLEWHHGERSVGETSDWRQLRSRFVIPSGTAAIQCRLTGSGPATIWLDDVVLTEQGRVEVFRNKDLPATLTISNQALAVTLQTTNATLEVTDRRGDRHWSQQVDESSLVILDAKTVGASLRFHLFDALSKREIAATVRLDEDRPEFVVTLQASGALAESVLWPPPFVSAKGEVLILPVNEGVSYPVDDSSLPPMSYHLYGGHGLCMPWYGATDGSRGWMAIVETPDDAGVLIRRQAGLLGLAPEWQPQKGQFGPARVLRYILFDRGGYVALAKRYREQAQRTGLFKTLAEKRQAIPAVDQLVGAVNVWCWEPNAPAICREMQSVGIRRILWSNACPADDLKVLNGMGVLTSRYDVYQDAMNPANFPKVRWIYPDWTSAAWTNNDLMLGPDGQWLRGWEVQTKDGKYIPCGILCDRQALAYAQARIPPELGTHPYRCRFIDTTTASPWRECYDPRHPMTRTESKHYKMELLRYVSEGCGLVCGSETGHDAAVPYVHYFEGMLSLGPYRIPDAGRNTLRAWEQVPPQVARFQTGHRYRLPLWELVYHDCVVAQWYWGDYNNKLPTLWDRRDLWNVLYGTPPMFMFDHQRWAAQRDRFVRSYRTATPVARATGYVEMLSHEWLTPDHAVQRTRFANGIVVTVNFGDGPCALPDGTKLPPLGHRVEGLKPPS